MTPTFAFLNGPEIAIIVGIAVLLFGADRIPKLARSMGQAKKEFETAQRGESASSTSPSETPTTTPPSAPTQPPAAPQP
jgi:sec-independent protein translocase protein TatA